jgi:hypothetical protein
VADFTVPNEPNQALVLSAERSWEPRSGSQGPGSSATNGGASLPDQISWHSVLKLQPTGPGWRTIYERGGAPVMAERSIGKGSVVFATDSYFLSNEAMIAEPNPELLAWLIGGLRRVVFNETHLGLRESPGVASLARKYRLHGVLFSLIVLGALFVWKNSAPLVPAFPESASDAIQQTSGKDALAGYVQLLRRNIPRSDVFFVGYSEWKASMAGRMSAQNSRLKEAEPLVAVEQSKAPKERDPVGAYQRIAAIISPRRGFRMPGAKDFF